MTATIISTKELLEKLDNPNLAVVDIRACEAFNGWKPQEEPRGGHIPGAISFPFSWLFQFSRTQLDSLLRSKEITTKKAVVVYGNTYDNCTRFAQLLLSFGIGKVSIYKGGLQEWAADASLPMEFLTNYKKLVYPDWIKQPCQANNQNILLVRNMEYTRSLQEVLANIRPAIFPVLFILICLSLKIHYPGIFLLMMSCWHSCQNKESRAIQRSFYPARIY